MDSLQSVTSGLKIGPALLIASVEMMYGVSVPYAYSGALGVSRSNYMQELYSIFGKLA